VKLQLTASRIAEVSEAQQVQHSEMQSWSCEHAS